MTKVNSILCRHRASDKIYVPKNARDNHYIIAEMQLTSDEPTFEPGAWFNLKHDAVQDISYQGILE
ncbi:hypothetical protein [Pseudoalteromonas sp. C2R02]|uniref:hypothetical protein n=1 Tax=Pseudoalteromonas sp. C2R02 TaxID=2841565 RepID=UPI0020911D2C|nr:hypothetical protein [Pseudoalteromonas sp. C2R02]